MNEHERSQAAAQHEALLFALRGDEAAVALCEHLFFISQVWDDLADGDGAPETEEIHQAFFMALVEIPRNPFYLRHLAELRPLIRASICDWFDANALEGGTRHEKTLAFVLRDGLAGLVSQCAYLAGGYRWMREVSPRIRAVFHNETLEDYLGGDAQ